MRAAMWAVMLASACGLSACNTVPSGAEGPGRHYGVSRAYNGFTGTQALRFGPYRVDMRFDAGRQFKRELKRGVIGALLGCKQSGCGMPRSPQHLPLDFSFAGPTGNLEGRCTPLTDALQCTLGDVSMRFDPVVMGMGVWTAQTPFGPTRVEWQDVDDGSLRKVEWRVIDAQEQVLAVVGDSVDTSSSEDASPSFHVWLADGHPEDHQALAKVTAILLAYAWHSSGS